MIYCIHLDCLEIVHVCLILKWNQYRPLGKLNMSYTCKHQKFRIHHQALFTLWCTFSHRYPFNVCWQKQGSKLVGNYIWSDINACKVYWHWIYSTLSQDHMWGSTQQCQHRDGPLFFWRGGEVRQFSEAWIFFSYLTDFAWFFG